MIQPWSWLPASSGFPLQCRESRVSVWKERFAKLAPIGKNVKADVAAVRMDWRIWRETRKWK